MKKHIKKFENSKAEKLLMEIADDDTRDEEERENAWFILGFCRAIENGELEEDNA